MVANYAAVDLGATSGRVMLGRVGPDTLRLLEAHRFDNRPVRLPSGLHWDILALYRGVLDGLARVTGGLLGGAALGGIGVDSWAVDHGLLDGSGALLGQPYHYRDARFPPAMRRVLAEVPAAEIYQTTGVQFLPFNTVYQLAAADPAQQAAARTLLLIPDLISYWLTGQIGAEATNASTTQLYDVRTQSWSTALMARLDLPARIFPPLRQPGDPAGHLRPEVGGELGLSAPVPVTAVASHDTASAVVAVPAVTDRFAYISCGTWALVGLELPAPVLSEASRQANFTNEGGVFGTIRYLRNVMGLWLLQECLRGWRSAAGSAGPVRLGALLAAAAREPAFAALIDPEDPSFLAPASPVSRPAGDSGSAGVPGVAGPDTDDMPGRIAAYCRRTGQVPPREPAAVVRCILDSLALAFRTAVRDAQRLSGRAVEVIHLVGGGAHNELLCQLTADACGLPVVAGPAEATALGNVLVQAHAGGQLRSGGGDVADLGRMRELVAATQPVRRYLPRGDQAPWAAAAGRLAPR